MKDIPLGKKTNYKFKYDRDLLVKIPRSIGREAIGLSNSGLPFQGVDIWNCYEVCWLNENGVPQVRILTIYVDCSSFYIVESKSLKLYLNSFSNQRFNSQSEVLSIIKNDLSELLNLEIDVFLKKLSHCKDRVLTSFDGQSIDSIKDVIILDYNVNKNLLSIENNDIVQEELCSDLLKSNCLVTNQPDWASVYIKYKGRKIDHKSLLKYIISYRNHSEFHEQCVEHMFADIMEMCFPAELTIYAKYTRRGGIDINPFRSSIAYNISEIDQRRLVRQ
ncbi:MAG TPA: NADPH-dependent 7-cyano-7-deazaguanine reductase QueF [Candidatus Megaira endosymbiont of Nemacystus decipiens]|nr:NADPH-dependent 7-cyano-7-deazaguanine reductase QueF [Candidatus Megaera endosymbiont of Nemacystus decipiens]